MMTKEQIRMLEELLETEGIKGKRYIEHALWLNTNQPKFKIGSYVLATERSMKIYGNTVIDFHGKVTAIKHFAFQKRNCYEVTVKVNGKEFKVFCSEHDLKKSSKRTMHNIVTKRSQHEELIDL